MTISTDNLNIGENDIMSDTLQSPTLSITPTSVRKIDEKLTQSLADLSEKLNFKEHTVIGYVCRDNTPIIPFKLLQDVCDVFFYDHMTNNPDERVGLNTLMSMIKDEYIVIGYDNAKHEIVQLTLKQLNKLQGE